MGDSKLITFQVKGNSMNPLLWDGDLVSVLPMDSYKMGDIVVATHPIQSDVTIVKQIAEVMPGPRFRLRGRNPKESTDRFGLVGPNNIIGKVISKLD